MRCRTVVDIVCNERWDKMQHSEGFDEGKGWEGEPHWAI